jgi:DNA (cytosine-5)-methyltransferase 1
MPSKQRQLRFIDVFAGCGGLSLGLSQAGLQGVFAVERDDCAFKTFETNFLNPSKGHHFRWPTWLPKRAISIDNLLRKYRPELASLEGRIDLLAGGPPCQGFSSAGRRQSDDPRNQLFRSYLKLVRIIKPKVVLIENVRGFTVDFEGENRSDNYSAKLVKALSNEYFVHDALLNLSAFGVPQNRVRYFVIAFQKGTVTGNHRHHPRQRCDPFQKR